jgi:hypothetical protein
MNEQLMENMEIARQAMRTINALGIHAILIMVSDNRETRIHLHDEFDPEVFGTPVTTDYERKGEYIEHSVMLHGANVFWLEERKQVAA